MYVRYLRKFGITIAVSILLSSLSWGDLQSQTVKSSMVHGPFYIALTFGKVAIIPFADYSHRKSFPQALDWGGNEKVTEKIRNYLVAKKLVVSNQKKVNELLASKGIINLMKDTERPFSFNWNIAKRPHNQLMTEMLMKSLISSHGDTEPLVKKEVIEIGNLRLGVDTIIRGRISKKKKIMLSDVFEKSKDLLSGVIPFRLNEIGPNTIGYATFEEYEAGLPPVDTTRAIQLRDTSFPATEASIITIDIYFQNAKTGKIEWSNRLELRCPVKYGSKAADASIEKGIKLLMDEFFSNYLFYYKGEWLCIKKKT